VAVPVLLAVVQDAGVDSKTRQDAAVGLGALGDAARPAVPVLRELVGDEGVDLLLRQAAGRALKTIDPRGAADAGVR
jgi:hypothetical protein